MSLFVPEFDETVIVREAGAEVVGRAPVTVRLPTDSGATGGALSTQRVTLTAGAEGARPHRHDRGAEMFFPLDGAADVLCGDDVVTAGPGDLVVVPPGRPHAFAAVPGADADLLIALTPGVERFEYFRHLWRIRLGEVPARSIEDAQDRYDRHFLSSPARDAHRS
ncbi:cupin domain-containing protein [Streptomyces sp. NPDC018947]|uniref:cupin domain-containing protein n=1 Tax=Streptomyces sp. NPDC018947 TaxID=3365054 RepID=UPI00379CD5C5